MARKPSNGRLALALTRAICIDERIATLDDDARASVGARRRAQARRAIRDWKLQPPYIGDGASFRRSLANIGVTERELEHLLIPVVTPGLRRRVRESTWWRAYSQLSRAEPATGGDPLRGPSRIAETLIADGTEALEAHVTALSGAGLFDAPACMRAARADVVTQLDALLDRTFRLERRIAELGGLLDDPPDGDATAAFERLWCSPAARKRLFSRYPLLLAEIGRCVETWLRVTIEFVERFCKDANDVSTRLFDGRPLRVRGWRAGAGDRHGGGRCTFVVELDDGACVVYKPRSLATDDGVGRFVSWINAHVPGTPLRAARVVDRGTHGWAEFVEHRELACADRAHDYYERQGKWLALFYVLHANDLHCDNAIACGDEPIYVDLETLFHPTHGMFQASTPERACDAAAVPPATVSDTFILPIARHLSTSDGTGYFDVSVMTSSIRRDAEGAGRGTMTHRPSFAGRAAVASDHVDAICAGFASVYEAVAAEREMLASDDGIPAMFAAAAFRIVVRPTTLYAQLLDHARHPDNLACALERRTLFSRIFVDGRPDLNACMRCEITDLEHGDIPRFERGFDDECIGDARGTRVAGLCLPSARSIMRHRLERLCRSDLEAQQALIRIMLVGDEARPAVAADAADLPNHDARMAVDIADGLLACSVVAGRDRYWICQTLLDGGLAVHAPGILNLYSGQLGVALTLGTAAAVLDRGDYADAALQAVATIRRWSDGGRRGFTSCGVFNGAMGYAYVLANLGAMLHRRDLVDEAIAVASAVPHAWRRDGLDVVDGAAGCVLFLANLQASLGTDSRAAPLTSALATFAERVAAAAIGRIGVAWHAPGAPDGLTGFAHGAAGYAAALAVAGQVLCRPDYFDLARQAIAFENSHYDASSGHWRDLRPGVADGSPLCAWCNGAAGILLGRWIVSRAGLDAPDVLRDMDRAARVVHERRSRHDSLCHGDAGNRDILDHVGSCVGTASAWSTRVDRASLDLATSPGLVVGAAGIAHAALRRAFPRRVPSVLALEVAPI